MIKGIDAQVMTNRTIEYAKDVSAQLRRDELSNEFAKRLNQAETETEMRSVNEMEEAQGSRVNADDSGNQGNSQNEGHQNSHSDDDEPTHTELPSVGRTARRLLDIEV